MITFLDTSIVNTLGGGFMKHTNKSFSELASPNVVTIASKLKHNTFGNIDGTSAIIADLKPKGKFCPFDR